MKFTFKTERPTGRYSSFFTPAYTIKWNKKWVGEFRNIDHVWKISLMVMKTATITDANPNCAWTWITLKVTFGTLEDAKHFINRENNIIAIHEHYTLGRE